MSDPSELLQRIAPSLGALEGHRLSILDKRRKGGLAMLIAGLLGALATLMIGQSNGTGALVVVGLTLIAGVIIYAVCFSGGKAGYQHRFKREVVARIAKELAPEMIYQPNQHVAKDWFRRSGLFSNRPERYTGEDYFGGRIGSTDLFFSEVLVQERRTRRNSNGRTETYYVTIFKGLFVVADFHKHFQSEIFVQPDGLERWGVLGKALQKLGGRGERMENLEFERLFKVRAGDPVEARYLLTPLIQERFVDLANRFGPKISASFRGSRIFLAIPKSTDWFEGRLDRSVRDPEQFRELSLQLQCCFGLVEQLDLNPRIWTKD